MDINALVDTLLTMVQQNPIVILGGLVLLILILMLFALGTKSDGGKRKKASRSTQRRLEKSRKERSDFNG